MCILCQRGLCLSCGYKLTSDEIKGGAYCKFCANLNQADFQAWQHGHYVDPQLDLRYGQSIKNSTIN